MAAHIGEQYGKYRFIRLLGQGNFADVYLGEHLYLKTEAAVKVLRTQLSERDRTGFLNEAQTIARLVHPHIVRIFDFDVQEGTPFLIMDYAPNGTLRQRHADGQKLPLRTIVEYVRQIADALQYAHDQKLIHRDVKPENILLGRRNDLLLSDFGIVQVAQTATLASLHNIAGTTAYMAPEQFQGRAGFASDQYAMAIMVYHWLSGKRPFSGTFSELASQHMFVSPPALSERDATIPPAVQEVVMTALAKEPKQRFGSVSAFARALEQAAFPFSSSPSLPTYAPPTPIPPMVSGLPSASGQSLSGQQPFPSGSPHPSASSGQPPFPSGPPFPSASSSQPPFPAALSHPSASSGQPPVLSGASLSSASGNMPISPSPSAQVEARADLHTDQAVSHPVGTLVSDLPRPLRKKKRRWMFLLLGLVVLVIASTATTALVLNVKKPAPKVPLSDPISVSVAPDGEHIGLSDGNFAFDTSRPDGSLKIQAANALKKKNGAEAKTLWQAAISEDTNDAEALIYLENQRVLASGHPYITLVVGTILTGDLASIGRDNLQGAYVAQKEFNAAFKLPGNMLVRLLVANSGNQRAYATTVARQIVQAAQSDKTIVGVMGWPFIGSTEDVSGILSAAHIPMVVATVSDDALTGLSPFLFRVAPPYKLQVRAAVAFVGQRFHAKSAVLFVDSRNTYSKNLAFDFQQQFIAGGNNIVATEPYVVGRPETATALLADALRANPDIIYFAGTQHDVIPLLMKLPTSGPYANLPVIGGDALAGTGSYPASASNGFNRLYFSESIAVNEWEAMGQTAKKPSFFTDYAQNFDPHQQHTTAYGYSRANNSNILSYDALLALLSGCRIALSAGKNRLSPVDLQRGLAEITGAQAIQGASGQIIFGPDGDPVNKAVPVVKLNAQGDFTVETIYGILLSNA